MAEAATQLISRDPTHQPSSFTLVAVYCPIQKTVRGEERKEKRRHIVDALLIRRREGGVALKKLKEPRV